MIDIDKINDNDFLINTSINSIIKSHPVIKIAVMASGKGSNFKSLTDAIKNKRLNAQIVILIVNNSDCKAIEIAKFNNIDFKFIDHRTYSSREDFDKAIVSILKQYDVELVVMAGWMRIVSKFLINSYKDRLINIHPSLLPSFKGTNSIQNSLDSGVTITGCTVHKVVEEVDSGEILVQAAVPILKNDNLITLNNRIQNKEHQILPIAIKIMACELFGIT